MTTAHRYKIGGEACQRWLSGPVFAADVPGVLVHMGRLVEPAQAGEEIILRKFRPCPLRRHGQLVRPKRPSKSLQRLLSSVILAYRKWIAPPGGAPAVQGVGRLPLSLLRCILLTIVQSGCRRVPQESEPRVRSNCISLTARSTSAGWSLAARLTSAETV